MSQSATFYRIDSKDFASLQSIEQFDWYSHHKGYTTLSSTHEGLRYLLSKGANAEVIEMVNQIIYPLDFLEQESGWEEDHPSERAILYHAPATVNEIQSFLDKKTEESVLAAFDPEEMNTNSIYHSCWHNDTSSSYGLTSEQLLMGFRNLKEFFREAKEQGQYVLVFVG